jgi:hypothetical protein
MWLREAVTGRVWRVAAVDPAGYGGPSDPSWSPDGRHLVYEWHRPGSGVPVVFAVGVDRAASVQLGEGWVLGWLGGETVRILAPERECPGNQASRWDVRVDGTGARLACSDEPPVAQPPAPVAPSGPPPPAPSAPQPPVRETEPPLPVRTTSPAAPDPAPAAARAPARPATLSVAEARGHARAALAGRVGRRPVKVLSCRRVARTAVRCRAGGHEVLVRRTVDGVTTRVTRAARARS